MGHFEEIIKKLHPESSLTFYDILKIYSKINGDIFSDNCIRYNTNYKMNTIYYSINSKKVSLLHYLFQSLDPKIPRVNYYSYRKTCKTKHCICLKHYKRYLSKWREKMLNPKPKIIINIDRKTSKNDLVVNFDQ